MSRHFYRSELSVPKFLKVLQCIDESVSVALDFIAHVDDFVPFRFLLFFFLLQFIEMFIARFRVRLVLRYFRF